MAVGLQVAQPQPAAIGTALMRAKVHRGVNLAWAPVRWRQGIGMYRHRGDDLFTPGVTQRARRYVRQACKRLRLGGTVALGRDGRSLCRWLSGRSSTAWPGQMKEEEEPDEDEQAELVEQQM